MASLYEIDQEIMGCVDAETGEIFDIEKFEELSMQRDAKIENVALWIKNLKVEAEALKAEKEAFAERQKQAERKMESLKNFLVYALNGTKFETTKAKISFRKSESLEISDEAEIPDEYLKVKYEVNKTDLKKAVKDGLVLEGVELVTKQNVQIK